MGRGSQTGRCLCSHGRDAHEHYRAGSECSLCSDHGCPRYRDSGSAIAWIAARFRDRGRRRPPGATSRVGSPPRLELGRLELGRLELGRLELGRLELVRPELVRPELGSLQLGGLELLSSAPGRGAHPDR